MLELLFGQYENYPIHEIILELTAVVFGLLSVWFAKKDNIWVFPTGLVNTALYVYLLFKWNLLGDMMINAYYFIMSIYGWYHWTRKKEGQAVFPVARITAAEKKVAALLFLSTIVFVVGIYLIFDKFTSWFSYVDTLLTALFFVGMWLMAKRKIENWHFWIIGDLISIPLYCAKGYTFTAIQYLIFTIIAVFGYLEWKRILQQERS